MSVMSSAMVTGQASSTYGVHPLDDVTIIMWLVCCQQFLLIDTSSDLGL
jgi:hypothetical protein